MRWPCLALVLAGTFAAGAAAAETEDERREAGRLFVEGQRAFGAGDFRHSAESFDAAYKLSPRLPALWNAARAWHRAGEPVRAANLYADYLDKAPPKAPDRASAIKSMKELEAKLGRLEIHAEGFDKVSLDGAPLDGARPYVTPGAHVVEGRKGEKSAREPVSAQAGTTTSVVLALPDEPKPAAPPPPPPAPPKKESHGLPVAVVAAGGVLTGVGAGLVVWSGLETLGQRSTFDKSPTQKNLDDGRSMETRTNVLLGVTIGLAAVTGALAIFTDFGGRKKEAPQARVVFGPGGFGVEGTFR